MHKDKVVPAVTVAVITVSDSRTEQTDASGSLARALLGAAGHQVVHYEVVPDEPDRLTRVLGALPAVPGCRAVLINGGTGIAARDTSYEAVARLIDKRLDGFGELFRSLSYAEIGPAAMISRVLAGTVAGRIVFLIPGSPTAVRLALEKLILPELPHLAWLLNPA
jgi:molybdenum cofactor biosynthesis protein B